MTSDLSTSTITSHAAVDLAVVDRQARAMLTALAADPGDPMAKPFAALAVALAACQIGAASSPNMKARLAQGVVILLRAIEPGLVVDLPGQETAH